eukprot:2521926-Karenia_brevis.AAC.1
MMTMMMMMVMMFRRRWEGHLHVVFVVARWGLWRPAGACRGSPRWSEELGLVAASVSKQSQTAVSHVSGHEVDG